MMLPGEDKKNTIKDKVLGVGAMFRFSAAKLLSEAKEKEKVKDKDADLPHRHTHIFSTQCILVEASCEPKSDKL